MDGVRLARLIGLGRIAFGLGLVVAPGRLTRRWLGSDSERGATQVGVRGLGARDIALGVGALTSPAGELPRWVGLSLAGDAADLLASLAAGDEIPLSGRIVVSALAAGGVAAGAVALAGLDSEA